jgi:hypothetical protein
MSVERQLRQFACPGLGHQLEVDPMVGGVLRFVDSGFLARA